MSYSTKDFFVDNGGKCSILIGVILIFLGILFLVPLSSSIYYIISSLCLFSGLIITCVGFLIELGFYSSPSFTGKISSVLITISFAFFAGAILVMMYRKVVGTTEIPIFSHGRFIGYRPIEIIRSPYLWLFHPFLITGISLLIAGIILKVLRE